VKHLQCAIRECYSDTVPADLPRFWLDPNNFAGVAGLDILDDSQAIA